MIGLKIIQFNSLHLTDAAFARQRTAGSGPACGARHPASQLGSTDDSSWIVGHSEVMGWRNRAWGVQR
jgi:hypothetical protein